MAGDATGGRQAANTSSCVPERSAEAGTTRCEFPGMSRAVELSGTSIIERHDTSEDHTLDANYFLTTFSGGIPVKAIKRSMVVLGSPLTSASKATFSPRAYEPRSATISPVRKPIRDTYCPGATIPAGLNRTFNRLVKSKIGASMRAMGVVHPDLAQAAASSWWNGRSGHGRNVSSRSATAVKKFVIAVWSNCGSCALARSSPDASASLIAS